MKKLNHILIALLSGFALTANAQDIAVAESQLADSVSLGYQLSVSTRTGSQSIAGVNSSAIEKSPYIDVTKALYGKIAGLNVYQGTGTSSDNVSSLSIHGHTPLILVDGYPRDIADITAGEIESIQILTDAASTALYGIRGANGVVLVTTKRGREGKLNVKVSYDLGVNTQFRSPEFADAYTYAHAYNSALVSDGLAPIYNPNELQAFRSGQYPYDFANVDWWNESFNKTGMSHNLKMSFNGGNDRFRYYAVVDYYNDRAMQKHNTEDDRFNSSPNDTRLSVRANIDVNITKSTYMKAGIMGKLREHRTSLYERDNPITNVLYKTPSAAFPVRYEDGAYGGNTLFDNPVYLLTDNGDFRRVFGTMTADLSLRQSFDALVKGLGAELSVSFDNVGAMQETSTKTLLKRYSNASIADDGTFSVTREDIGTDQPTLGHGSGANTTLLLRSDFQAKIDYARTFGKHNVSGAVIYDMQAVTRTGVDLSTKNMSILVTASYNYDDRYSLTAVYNHSGSSRLPKGAKFADYPAVSAAWIISNEQFLKGTDNLDLLRLRGSFGYSGWDGNFSSSNMWRSQYATSGGGQYYFGEAAGSVASGSEGPLAVAGLVAERSERGTLGLDAIAFGERLRASVEGFTEKRSNILVSASNGTSGILGADMTNNVPEGINRFSGVDFSLSWQDKIGDFGYGIGVTGSYLTSKILNQNEAYKEYDYLYHKGNPVGQCYGLEAIGFFSSQQDINNSPTQTFSDVRPGDVKYKDQNGDNRIDEKDIVKMYGTTAPKFYYGFNLNFSYKGFELSADFQGMAGVTVNLLNSPIYQPFYNNTVRMNGAVMGENTITTTFLKNEIFWTDENKDKATMPRLTTVANANNTQASSLWYRDGSFLKLRNLTVAYTFPKSMTRFADLKIFLTGTNLFSADRLGFADPEQIIAAYPSTRSYWAGIKFNF
ncbi:MAG: SusC/RagA family TonB-linked outer membrane protein [Alistipes sp.]|nr:SusC/RagA family TonB-linked outer membrane protein [Alistipes sp.]